jgi:hypothetical protein
MNAELIDLSIEEQNRDEMDFALNEGYYEEIKQYAQRLGLEGQIDLADEALRKLRRPKILTPCLSKDELLIWQEFLTTSYRGTVSMPVDGSRSLPSYRFDLIPKHIHQQWTEWVNGNVFEEFEIRTEEESLDPALFGIRHGKYWLLARWGASDETLISFAEIKELIRERFRVDRHDQGIAAGVFLAASLFCFGPVIKVILGIGPRDGLGMLVPSIFAFLVALSCWIQRNEKVWSAVNKR